MSVKGAQTVIPANEHGLNRHVRLSPFHVHVQIMCKHFGN